MEIEVNHILSIGRWPEQAERDRQIPVTGGGKPAATVTISANFAARGSGANCEESRSERPVSAPNPAPARQRLWQLHRPGHKLNCELAFEGPSHGWMVTITLDASHVGGYRTRTRRGAEAWAQNVRGAYLGDGWHEH